MITRILNAYLNNLKCKNIPFDDNFINAEYENLSDLIRVVNLPERVKRGDYIDIYNLPHHLQNLYSDIDSLCYSTHSGMVNVYTYEISPYIVSLLVEKMYKKCLREDVTLPVFLYIDTESFVSDLSIYVAQSKNDSIGGRRLRNPIAVMTEYIYSAQFVFWDRFRFGFGDYYDNYIYEVIKGRYNDCLGNLFFSDTTPDLFITGLNKNILPVLDIKATYNIIEEQSAKRIMFIGGGSQNEGQR